MPVKELDDYLDSDPDILNVEDLVEKDGDKCSAGQKDKLKKVLRDAKQRGTDAEKVTQWAYMTLLRRWLTSMTLIQRRNNVVCLFGTNPGNTTHLPNVWPMLGQRHRRWANIGQTLGRCVVFAGNSLLSSFILPCRICRIFLINSYAFLKSGSNSQYVKSILI